MRSLVVLRVAVGLCAAAASLGSTFAQSYPHAFPREGVVKLHETERLILWQVNWVNGVAQPVHRHQYDMASIYMRWGAVRVTPLNGKAGPVGGPFPAPSPYFQRKGVTHTEEGVGGPADPARAAITVDLKDGVTVPPFVVKPGAIAAFPRVGATAVLNNERVVIWEYIWQPKRAVPMHVHDKDSVEVFVEPGIILSKSEDGKEESYSVAFNTARFVPRGVVHSEEATSGSPKAFVIELK